MPYKSKAQQRKFHAMEKQGKMPASTVAEFDKASQGHALPDHVKQLNSHLTGGHKNFPGDGTH
jgi:hypothetical protein